MRALVLLALLLLAACGPGPTTSAVQPGGYNVFVDPSAGDDPSSQPGMTPLEVSEAVAYVVSVVHARGFDQGQLASWFITIEPYPVTLPSPEINPFNGEVINTATSYTDFQGQHLGLSWYRLPKLEVEDVNYELSNVACMCESGLRPGAAGRVGR
jgi:hypothetical protein